MTVLTSTVSTAATASMRDSLLRRVLTPKPSFTLTRPDDPERGVAESFVRERFLSAWGARVTHFLPFLLDMHCVGQCTAVAGIRPAATGPLFLERYLDARAETVLGATLGRDVARSELVEIGNLVASQRGASHLLFLIFSAVLHRAGYRWIVFTATHGLRNNLAKLGYPALTLAGARPERLDPATRAEWGSYYDSDPVVMAGSLDEALRIIAERPLLRRVLRLYRGTIDELAAVLGDKP